MTTHVAIIGAGSVGRALGAGLSSHGTEVVFGVRDPSDPRHGLGRLARPAEAVQGAAVVVLAIPAAAVPDAVAELGLGEGQVVIDATNSVGAAVPGGHATMGDLVAALVPPGVAVAKAFNTVGAEHLSGGESAAGPIFLPIAGDPAAVEAAGELARRLGYDVAVLGGREHFGMVEAHAQLWIHLAFRCGWGRGFAFTVARA